MININRLASIIIVAIIATPAFAMQPPMWRDPIANSDPLLFGNGFGSQNRTQALGFSFPFQGAGGSTSTITIGTHGGIALAGGKTLENDIWSNTSFESKFSAEGTPRILAFSTGLSHGVDTTVDVEGVYFFTNNSDRAYITWYRVAGAAEVGTAIISAQIELRKDGTIILGYDVEAGANFTAATTNGIVVGVSDGQAVWPTGSSDFTDLNTSDIDAGSTTYQIWCRNGAVSSCFQQNGTDTHDNFDLDGKNVVFNPTPGLGYTVSRDVKAGTNAGACITISANPGGSANPGEPVIVAMADTASGGGGGGNIGVGLLFLLPPFSFVIKSFYNKRSSSRRG